MIKVILCAHGELALAMKHSIEMVYGQCDGLTAIAFNNHENREILVQKITAQLDEKEKTLIMVDLFGGSPFNAASELAFNLENVEVITGMSLPLCLEMVDNLSDLTLPQLVEHLVAVGKNCVIPLQKTIIHDDMEDF